MDQNEIRELADQADEILGEGETQKDLIALLETIASKFKQNGEIQDDLSKLGEILATSSSETAKSISQLIQSVTVQSQTIIEYKKALESIANKSKGEADHLAKFLDRISKYHNSVIANLINTVQKLNVAQTATPEEVKLNYNGDRLSTVVEDFGQFKLKHSITFDSGNRITRVKTVKESK